MFLESPLRGITNIVYVRWLRDVHVASRGTYGYRRVHAELTQAHGVFVSANLVNLLMHNAAITGLPGPGKASRNAGVPTDDDLVNRRFNRDGLNELWVSDITEHKTQAREGKYTAAPFWTRAAEKLLVGLSILFRIHNWSSTRLTWR